MVIYMTKYIILDIDGIETADAFGILSNCYGCFVWTCNLPKEMMEMVRSISIWDGATKKRYDANTGDYIYGFEVNAHYMDLFMSNGFHRICEGNKVTIGYKEQLIKMFETTTM